MEISKFILWKNNMRNLLEKKYNVLKNGNLKKGLCLHNLLKESISKRGLKGKRLK